LLLFGDSLFSCKLFQSVVGVSPTGLFWGSPHRSPLEWKDPSTVGVQVGVFSYSTSLFSWHLPVPPGGPPEELSAVLEGNPKQSFPLDSCPPFTPKVPFFSTFFFPPRPLDRAPVGPPPPLAHPRFTPMLSPFF